MQNSKILCALALGALLAGAGCRKSAIDKMIFKSAIDRYYASKPVCVWNAAVKLPAQADAKDDDQTRGFDALTDAGMLTRKPVEKKRFLIGSKPVNDYDLSDKGRATWTADPAQPGYGNFCYGNPEVTTIDSYLPADNPEASQYTVSFHLAVKSAPGWANSAEMKTAFPKVAADTSGSQTATADLSKGENGWQVTSVQPAAALAP